MTKIVHKTQIVPFVNTGTEDAPVWTQIKKSTAFTISMNPQTKTFDYISSVTPEEILSSYQPSLDQDLVMTKGEADYDLFFSMFYNLPTGSDAKKQVLIAFYQEKMEGLKKSDGAGGEEEYTGYMGWLCDSLVKVNNLNSVDQTISISLSFGEVKAGCIEIVNKKPVFTAGSFATDATGKATFTPSSE